MPTSDQEWVLASGGHVPARREWVGYMYTVISFFAASFNLVILLAIFVTRRLRRDIYMLLIAGQASTDFAYGVTLLVFMARNLSSGYWVGGQRTCDIYSFIGVVLACATLMHLALLAYLRHRSVTSAAELSRTRYAVYFVAVWVAASLTGMFVILEAKAILPPAEWYCRIDATDQGVILPLLSVFGVLNVLIIYSYADIIRQVWQVESAVTRSTNTTNATWVITKTMIVVVVALWATWGVVVVVMMYDTFGGTVSPTVDILVAALGGSNSFLNPLIYAGMNKRIRDAIVELFTCRANDVSRSSPHSAPSRPSARHQRRKVRHQSVHLMSLQPSPTSAGSNTSLVLSEPPGYVRASSAPSPVAASSSSNELPKLASDPEESDSEDTVASLL